MWVMDSSQGSRMTNNILGKKIKINELDVHYFTGGQGDPLVVIHGGGDGARAWMKNIAELSENYTVYVPDLPGYGHSQPIDGDYYIPEMVEFVDEFTRTLGLKSFHLMGHSLGGGVALNYALKFPHKIMKLVLVSSMCLGREIALWVRVLSVPAICRAIGKTVIAVLKAVKWVADLILAPVEFMNPMSATRINLGSRLTTLKEQATVFADRLSEIVVPTLVVWGAKDPIVPVSQAYTAAALIPNCQVKVFEGCGHSVYKQKVKEFSHLLTRFLS